MTTDNRAEVGDELLPCPFCGAAGEDLMLFCDPEEGRDNSGPSRRIQCAGCNIEAPFYESKAEAIAAWNRRAFPTAQQGVAVKPLEWSEQHQRRSDEDPMTEVIGFEAETVFGKFYHIEVGTAWFRTSYDYEPLGEFETEKEAKAAAQADYEQRILSAISTPPKPIEPTDEEVEAAARAIASAAFEESHEGDAEAEWDRVAHLARAAITAASRIREKN